MAPPLRVGPSPITTTNIKRFRRELRNVSVELSKDLSALHKEVGMIVVPAARANAAATPQGSGKYVAKTIKARKLVRAIAVDMGGAGGVPRHPTVYRTAAINEFGTKDGAYRRRGFQPWVGNRYTPDPRVGYMIGQAVADNEQKIIDTYGDGIDRIAAKAFTD